MPLASQNCPVCGRVLESKDPRRSILRHIQSLRKKGDPAHTQYYNEAPDIRKRRRKDEMPIGSPLTRKAEKRQRNTESKQQERESSKQQAIEAVGKIPGENLGNIRLYNKSHQQSLFYMQKHRIIKKADESPLPCSICAQTGEPIGEISQPLPCYRATTWHHLFRWIHRPTITH
jgi:hypothetical protein